MKRSKIHVLSLGLFTYAAYFFFRAMPLDMASATGARLVRFLGPKLRSHKTAVYNLKRAFPEMSDAEIETHVMDMWDNLGRVVCEFPHIPRLKGKKLWDRVSVSGAEHLEKARAEGKGFIIYSGHLGNWELAPKSAYEYGMPLALVYRPANNPYIERLYQKSRKNSHAGMFAKGVESARNIFRTLKKGGGVGMLIDQKMNGGIPIPFFGRDAMTAPAMADIAIKVGCPLIGARVIRTKGAYFKVEVLPPLEIEGKDSKIIMTEVNQLLEKWIREYPAQWLWLHRRWPREEDQPR